MPPESRPRPRPHGPHSLGLSVRRDGRGCRRLPLRPGARPRPPLPLRRRRDRSDGRRSACSVCACVSSEWRPFLPREFIDGLRCWKIGKNRRLRRNSRLPSGFHCAAGVQRRSKIPLLPLCKVFTSHDAIWPLLLLEYEANNLISKNLTLSCGLFSFDLCLPCSKCSLYPLHFLCLQGRNSLFAFSL